MNLRRLPLLLLLLLVGGSVVALGLAGACGGGDANSESPAGQVQKVITTDRVFAVDDVVAAGLKKGKQYDVTGLTGATGAWLGFFGPSTSDRKDYELRFYPTHDEAVRLGAALADEGVGEGMRAKKESQTWTEGARDRWFAGGVTDVSSPGSRQAPGPKYWDYVIYGNLIMLCQGADSMQSLENCSALVQAMGGPDLLKK